MSPIVLDAFLSSYTRISLLYMSTSSVATSLSNATLYSLNSLLFVSMFLGFKSIILRIFLTQDPTNEN